MWVGVATCAPLVCVVVAHGWNIIEFFLLLSGLGAGWWWGRHAVGSWENRPLQPLFCAVRRPLCGWCVAGVVGVCGSPGRPCSRAPRLCGVCGWVSGGGSWFFHSGREHLGIMTGAPVVWGCGCGVLCNFCCCVSCVIRLALLHVLCVVVV